MQLICYTWYKAAACVRLDLPLFHLFVDGVSNSCHFYETLLAVGVRVVRVSRNVERGIFHFFLPLFNRKKLLWVHYSIWVKAILQRSHDRYCCLTLRIFTEVIVLTLS